MVGGEIGVSGANVPLAVEVLTKAEPEYVTVLLHNMEETIALQMDHQMWKPKDATKILVQVSTNYSLINKIIIIINFK